MKPRHSVALLIETSNAYARGLLEGVIQYIREHEAWSVFLPEQERAAKPPRWLARWKGDGIIARIETDEIAQAVRKSKLPVVDVSAARHVPNIPWVETDDHAIAQLAADHLLDRGFSHLGFCGDGRFNWSKWREQHFVDILKNAGHECHIYQPGAQPANTQTWAREKTRLMAWLSRLPKPIGILACYDIRAQQLLDVCRELNLAVPEQVAVLGVDNDQLVCNLCDPPLSSVIPNAQRTGYEAAALLDRMMSGQPIPPEAWLIAPLGIETRQSTDILAIDDPDVAKAVRYIRERVFGPLQVGDVLREVPLSRRVLEARFRKILGRTPHEEITRLRIERVKQLLLETDLTLATIAARTGFQYVEYLSVAFKKQVGISPSQYRKTERHSK